MWAEVSYSITLKDVKIADNKTPALTQQKSGREFYCLSYTKEFLISGILDGSLRRTYLVYITMYILN